MNQIRSGKSLLEASRSRGGPGRRTGHGQVRGEVHEAVFLQPGKTGPGYFYKDLDREEAKRLERDFVDKNRGFWQAFNPYLMPGELQIRFDRSPPFATQQRSAARVNLSYLKTSS
jgi:hypothetical protein